MASGALTEKDGGLGMPYGRSALVGGMQAGDPFLGGLVKGIGKFATGAVGGLISGGSPISAISGGLRSAFGGPQVQPPAMPGSGFGPGPGGITGVPGRRGRGRGRGGQKKYKRMNYSNQKALRRALRRATGYARQQKAVKKAASEFAREFGPKRSARRDLGPRHSHVR